MEAVRRPQLHEESTDEGAEEEDLSETIYDQNPCPSEGCPLDKDHVGSCAYPGELAGHLKPAAPRSAVELAMGKCAGLDGVFIPKDEHLAIVDEPRQEDLDRVPVGTMMTLADTRNPREVAIGQNPFVAKKEEVLREVVSSKYSMRRRGRTIPERGRMVVARVEWDELHGSIFILPNHVKNMTESNMEVVVLGCGPLRIDPVTGKEVPMSFSTTEVIGKHAIIREHAGLEFTWYDENGKQLTCYFIGQSEIWAWLEPFEGDEMNSPEISQAIAYLGPAPKPCDKFCAVCSLRSCVVDHKARPDAAHNCGDCMDLDEVLEWKMPEGIKLCEDHRTYFQVRPPVRGRPVPYLDQGCCDAAKVILGPVESEHPQYSCKEPCGLCTEPCFLDHSTGYALHRCLRHHP